MKSTDFNTIAESEKIETQYGVQYTVFAGRGGKIATKEKWFATEPVMESFVAKLEKVANFHGVVGYSYPKGYAPPVVLESNVNGRIKIKAKNSKEIHSSYLTLENAQARFAKMKNKDQYVIVRESMSGKTYRVIGEDATGGATCAGAVATGTVGAVPGVIKRTKAKESVAESDKDYGTSPFEARGVRGLDNKPWTKTFKNGKQCEAWCEKFDAEVHGTRDLDAAQKGRLAPAVRDAMSEEQVDEISDASAGRLLSKRLEKKWANPNDETEAKARGAKLAVGKRQERQHGARPDSYATDYVRDRMATNSKRAQVGEAIVRYFGETNASFAKRRAINESKDKK